RHAGPRRVGLLRRVQDRAFLARRQASRDRRRHARVAPEEHHARSHRDLAARPAAQQPPSSLAKKLPLWQEPPDKEAVAIELEEVPRVHHHAVVADEELDPAVFVVQTRDLEDRVPTTGTRKAANAGSGYEIDLGVDRRKVLSQSRPNRIFY